MGIKHYNSQEGLDDSFEDMMEHEEKKVRLQEEIVELEHKVDMAKEELKEAEERLKTAQKELLDLIEEG